jgi:hypothetical protein
MLVCGLLGYKFAQSLDKEKDTPEPNKEVIGSVQELVEPLEFGFAEEKIKKKNIALTTAA